MKKSTAVLGMILMAVFLFCFSAAPVSASETATEIHLISADSGYKINVPGFIGLKTVTAGGGEVSVVAVETPERGGDGRYPVFEITADNADAFSVKSVPKILSGEQAGSFEGNFSDGRLIYAPLFSPGAEPKDPPGDRIFTFNFDVYDKEGNKVFSVTEVNFMFIPVAASLTGSKITVDGKPTAFEAYEINGSNYFKLRDLAMVINGTAKQFQIEWDSAGNVIKLTSGTAYTPVGNELAAPGDTAAKTAAPSGARIYLDGNEIGPKAYRINGSTYFKLRDVGKLFDFGVTWDAQANSIGMDTTAGYAE